MPDNTPPSQLPTGAPEGIGTRHSAGISPSMSPSPNPALKRRGFQPLRDLPTLIWFIALFIVALVHRNLPVPGWLLLHLLFLGAVTHSILVWSQHFTLALTRAPLTGTEHRSQQLRLALANLGALLVLIGVPIAGGILTVAGSAFVVTAVAWHGVSIWARMRSALPGRFTKTLRYYVVSAACLAVGAGLGGWLGSMGDPSGRLTLAHAIINTLGWVGITIAGTLVTLWPTMLRTRADEHAAPHAARALPVLGAAVLIAAIGAITGLFPLVGVGLAGYAVGLAIIGVSLWRAARGAPPRSFATLSVGAGFAWWIAILIALLAQTLSAWFDGADISTLRAAISAAAPYLAAGFAAQVLLGALSYLAPVALGGGPTPVRIGTRTLDAFGPFRVATVNAALLVCALPVPSVTRVAASALYLLAAALFIPLFLAALVRQSRAKREGQRLTQHDRAGGDAVRRSGPLAAEGTGPAGRRSGSAVAGLLAVVLLVAGLATLDPQSVGGSTQSLPAASSDGAGGSGGSSAEADAPVQTVQVEAANMRFTPDRIEVAAGTHLIIEVTNTDASLVHDLSLANGIATPRLSPGQSSTLDVGVLNADLAGWCSIIGHREMGMTLEIVVTASSETGASGDTHMHGSEDGAGGSGDAAGDSAAGLIDLTRPPGEGFVARDATLDPLPPASQGPVTHRIDLPVTELVVEVAPGVQQKLWTFGGTAPGPIFHGRVGDTFEVTLRNDGTIGHSIDFHAGALAPDEPMRTIAPGESLTYTFTATRSGIWMYHCSTMPISAHIANGMYGAVIIEAADLPEVDRSYVLVQGEYYLGPQAGEVSMERLATEQPDLTVFNGYAAQYDHDPLPAQVGERVRVWLLDAGPNRASSFHVIGGQFDTVWTEGRYLINRATDTGSQALALQPAQGGFVELVFPEAGNYPFVTHIMADAERGAHGIFRVQ